MLLNFLSFKHTAGCVNSSLKLYVQALRHKHVLSGLDLTPFASPRVKPLIQGAGRAQPVSHRIREAMTLDDMSYLASYLQSAGLSARDRAMLWSAMTLAFHGLMRVSEYTVRPDGSSLDISQITILPDAVRVHLKVAKTAQYGEGQEVCVQRTTTMSCPHVALSSYLAFRGHQRGPLFTFQDGSCLKASSINSLLKSAFPSRHLSSHSLRIGAATLAGQHNLPEYHLQDAGRWRSTA